MGRPNRYHGCVTTPCNRTTIPQSKNPYKLLDVLNPIDAYDLRLVRRIEVASLVEDQSFNSTYVGLKEVVTPVMRFVSLTTSYEGKVNVG